MLQLFDTSLQRGGRLRLQTGRPLGALGPQHPPRCRPQGGRRLLDVLRAVRRRHRQAQTGRQRARPLQAGTSS